MTSSRTELEEVMTSKMSESSQTGSGTYILEFIDQLHESPISFFMQGNVFLEGNIPNSEWTHWCHLISKAIVMEATTGSGISLEGFGILYESLFIQLLEKYLIIPALAANIKKRRMVYLDVKGFTSRNVASKMLKSKNAKIVEDVHLTSPSGMHVWVHADIRVAFTKFSMTSKDKATLLGYHMYLPVSQYLLIKLVNEFAITQKHPNMLRRLLILSQDCLTTFEESTAVLKEIKESTSVFKMMKNAINLNKKKEDKPEGCGSKLPLPSPTK